MKITNNEIINIYQYSQKKFYKGLMTISDSIN